MENKLTVVDGNNAQNTSTTDTTLTTVTGIAETAPYTNSGTTFISGYQPYTTITTFSTNLTVRAVTNGFVVDFQYSTYVAKTQKELNKLITQLLTPSKKGKK